MKKKTLFLTLLTIGMLTACQQGSVSNEEILSNATSNNSTENSSINFSNRISSGVITSTSSGNNNSSNGPISSSQAPSSSKTQTSKEPIVYTDWDIDVTLRGAAFRDALAKEINKRGTKTTSYNSMVSVGAKAAAYGTSGKFIPFYHGPERLATQGECNREHTWPDSRGGGNIENDPFVIRPTLNSENSDRSNYFYGLNGKSAKEWDPASCGYAPARGESARVIFYIACRYGKRYNFNLTNTPDDNWNKVKTMGRLDRIYEWNQLYPPTDNEKQINNYLESQGYGRNPFVDHPELVEYIWDKDGILTDQANYYSVSGLTYHSLISKCIYLDNSTKIF